MISWGDYIARYWNAVRSSKYVVVRLGPVLTLLILSLVGPLWAELRPYALWIGIFWAFVVVFWWSYDVLNEELEKRDAEYLQTTPRAREDRAFRLLSKLLVDGKHTLTGWTPEQIEKWDKDVRLALAQWCNEGALASYLNSTRAYGQDRLTEPQKALDQLTLIVNFHLPVYMK